MELPTTRLYLSSSLLSEARELADERNFSYSAYLSLAIESHAKLDEADIDTTPDSYMFDVSTGLTTPFVEYHDTSVDLHKKISFLLIHSSMRAYGKAELGSLAEAEQVRRSRYVAYGLIALNHISRNARFFPVMVRSPETGNHVLVG